jgi:NitT/TauT family transport system substrate-binding protein
MTTTTRRTFLATAAAVGFATPLRAQAAKVSIGVTGSATDVGLWVADAKGYFKDEGIEVQFNNFDSAARMNAVLGSGELDVGAGGPSAGLFNAVGRGIDIRIVADKSQNVTGRGSQKLLVRKDLIDSGRYKSFADLKGMKIAGSAPGSSASTVILKFLEKGGVKPDEIDNVYMSFPQMGVALKNKAVDAALPAQPAVSTALRLGDIVAVANDYDVYPVHQISTILYSGRFAKSQPEVARKFMRAFLRGVRYHNDALALDGNFSGTQGDEIVSILTQYGPFKDPAVWRSFVFSACGPDGTLHMPSMKDDLDVWRKQGLIEVPVEVEKAVDTSYLDWAMKELGPYKRKG